MSQSLISRLRDLLDDLERKSRHGQTADALNLTQQMSQVIYRLQFELAQEKQKNQNIKVKS